MRFLGAAEVRNPCAATHSYISVKLTVTRVNPADGLTRVILVASPLSHNLVIALRAQDDRHVIAGMIVERAVLVGSQPFVQGELKVEPPSEVPAERLRIFARAYDEVGGSHSWTTILARG